MTSSPEKNRLFVCYDESDDQVFFASMIELKSGQAQIRSSYQLSKGDSIIMMPVPKGWDGEAIEKEKILGHVGSFQALINRTEGKGSYQLRMISHDDHQLMQRMRQGKTNEETLNINIKHAGKITTFHLAGGIGVTSAAKLQTAILELPEENSLILLDFTQLSYFIKSGSGILHTVLKSITQKGKVIHIVVKPESQIEEILKNSKIDHEFAIFDNREDAVSSLLATTIE